MGGKKNKTKPGMVAKACNPNTQEAEEDPEFKASLGCS
jgi:hypothetical protein